LLSLLLAQLNDVGQLVLCCRSLVAIQILFIFFPQQVVYWPPQCISVFCSTRDWQVVLWVHFEFLKGWLFEVLQFGGHFWVGASIALGLFRLEI
jgi:hypothetical protein